MKNQASVPDFHLRPVAGALGAEILGLDLSKGVQPYQFDALEQAFHDYLVLFFPNQELDPSHLVAFAKLFGEVIPTKFEPPFDKPDIEGFPEIYQFSKEPESQGGNVGGYWHADVTYKECPNLASAGYLLEAPDFGGDTLYSNLYLAYETLSPGMKELLGGLTAIHSSTMPHAAPSLRSRSLSRNHAPVGAPEELRITNIEKEVIEHEHPVVRRHPGTGRKSLYVNRGFTVRFAGMSEEESLPLLQFLWSHMERPEFTCRYHLARHSLVLWDNRCTLHYALNDYHGARRTLQRVSIKEAVRPYA